MTFFYQTQTWNSQPQIVRQTKDLWTHLSQKKNWRIVQLSKWFLPNRTQRNKQRRSMGLMLHERETLEEQSKLLIRL